MTTYTAITFAPVQGFITKSRKLRDLYGGSFILSYLARTICDVAKKDSQEKTEENQYKQYEIISPAIIKLTQGTPNQIILERETHIHEKEAESYFKEKFDEAWQQLVQVCCKYIESLVPRDDYSWQKDWNAWGNYAWEFFFAQGKPEGTITDVREKLNEVKRARNWIGINWIGESSSLSGIDGVAWYGMRDKAHPKQASMGELDDQIRDFYSNLSNALNEKLGNPIIDKNEQLSIPELIKRFVTLYPIKSKLKANNFPQIEIPTTFKDISRQKDKDSNNKNEENRWTGWFQGDGDKIGDYLKSLVDQGNITERDALKQFSTALINWGQNFSKELPNALDSKQASFKTDGRIIYAGGDDFLGVLYRNYDPKLTGRECLEWFYTLPDIWAKHEQEITVSVGFIWAAPSVPQRDVLEHGREAEQSAKQNGRDRLAIRILFNSGNYIEWYCPWRLLKPIMSAADVDWIHFYKDVATLEARHGFENQREIAIALFNIYFPNLKETVNLNNQEEWFNGEKTGILGEKINYQNQDETLDYKTINNAINNWVRNLAKVGFHLREKEAENLEKLAFPSVGLR